MSNRTTPPPGPTGKLRLACSAVGGVFAGAARAVVDWTIRTFVEN
ncbi:hypothetical protein [Streptomyces sp. NPDC056949]